MKYCKFRQYLPDDDKFHYWGFIGGGFVSPLLRVFRENEKGTYEWNDVPAKKVLGNSDHSIGMADKNGNDDGFVNFYGGKVKTKFRKEEEQC